MTDVTDEPIEFVPVAPVGEPGGDGDPVAPGQGVDEGDIAADYIEELLDICDLDGDIDIEERGGRAYVSVDAADSQDLRLLSNPETVTALQELTRLAVQNKTGVFSRLILDVGGSRDARQVELAGLVDRAIERIAAGAASASLPPMSSWPSVVIRRSPRGRAGIATR
jgi:spoIIIJ-associated protein